MRRLAYAIILITMAAGCAMKPAPLYRDQRSSLEGRLPQVRRDDLMNELSMYHGTRYEEGGSSLSGGDCSGLVHSVFGSLGIPLARTTKDQFKQGIPVSRRDVRTGDLIFFGDTGVPTHVGIAVSGTEMMHASSSKGVVLEDIDSFSRVIALAGIRRVARLD